MTSTRTFVIDPCDDLLSVLSRAEDRLLWAEPEHDTAAAALRGGAWAARHLYGEIRDAIEHAPALVSPAGRELAPIARSTHPLGPALVALRRAVEMGPHRLLHGEERKALNLLDRCAKAYEQPAATDLQQIYDSEPATAVVLDADQWRVYRDYVRAVLVDPLDRFVALGDIDCVGLPPTSAAALWTDAYTKAGIER